MTTTNGSRTYLCPVCSEPMPDGLTVKWLGHGPREHGYCARCSRRYETDPLTGEHRSDSWAPLCHECGAEVLLDKVRSDLVDRYYMCRDHPAEVWKFQGDDRWQWAGDRESPSAHR